MVGEACGRSLRFRKCGVVFGWVGGEGGGKGVEFLGLRVPDSFELCVDAVLDLELGVLSASGVGLM